MVASCVARFDIHVKYTITVVLISQFLLQLMFQTRLLTTFPLRIEEAECNEV